MPCRTCRPWAQPSSSGSGVLASASRVRKNWNRARLVGVGSSCNRPESSAARSRRLKLSVWRSRAMASGRLRLQPLGFFLDLLDLALELLRLRRPAATFSARAAISPRAMPPSTWSTPRRSRPSQRRGDEDDSGGSGRSGALFESCWAAGGNGDGDTAPGGVAGSDGALRQSPGDPCHHLSHRLPPEPWR
jgi:hypothetical protein